MMILLLSLDSARTRQCSLEYIFKNQIQKIDQLKKTFNQNATVLTPSAVAINAISAAFCAKIPTVSTPGMIDN